MSVQDGTGIESLLYSYTEAAARLNVSESWLRKQGAARAVPFTKLGKTVRFSEQNLQEIIAANTVQARLHSGTPRRRRTL